MITSIIHTHNEESNIVESIESARSLTDAVIVVDMESDDKTVDRAKKQGALVFSFPYHRYVEPARAFGISKARTDWVFILDADERMTKELAEEIKTTLSHTAFTYYKLPRKNIFANRKWLKYGGWYPDYQIRLIKKSALILWGKEIHAVPKMRGECGTLRAPLLHYFHPTLANMVDKTIIYEDIESDLLFQAHKRVHTVTFFRKFLGELYRRLIVRAGFLDGPFGIIESIYQAFSKTITYIFLYEKNRRL